MYVLLANLTLRTKRVTVMDRRLFLKGLTGSLVSASLYLGPARSTASVEAVLSHKDWDDLRQTVDLKLQGLVERLRLSNETGLG